MAQAIALPYFWAARNVPSWIQTSNSRTSLPPIRLVAACADEHTAPALTGGWARRTRKPRCASCSSRFDSFQVRRCRDARPGACVQSGRLDAIIVGFRTTCCRRTETEHELGWVDLVPGHRRTQRVQVIWAAAAVFARSIAMVIGPTPPGTGVRAPAISRTAVSTSPHNPLSDR